MKRPVLSFGALVLAGPLLAAPKNVTLNIKGWTCGSCAGATKIALKKLNGVTDVKTNAQKMQALVGYDDAKVTPDAIVAAVAKLGYKATVSGGAVAAAPSAKVEAAPAPAVEPISFFRAPLACQAAAGLGCGSASKPILKELGKSPQVAEAKINHAGTVLVVVWKDPAHGDPGIVNAAFEKRDLEAERLTGESREQALRDFEAGNWYGAADVDRLSEREAQVIAARLVKRTNGRLGLSGDRLGAFEKDLSAAIAQILTDDECESREKSLELVLTKAAKPHLDERQLAELRKAARQGVRALDGETK
jgi:copper chaperone